jgi:hypothetical protein
MVGYSGTPLIQKLGIKPDSRVAVVGAPKDFPIAGAKRLATLAGELDVIIGFVKLRGELAELIATARPHMAPACGLWVAWPKKASKVATEITEDVVRELALPTGLVDNKVCAIDETWSGLRLVIRKELRPARTPRRSSAR